MANLHVVLDSTAHVPLQLLTAHPGLHVVPLRVRHQDQEWPEDGIDNAALFELVEQTKVYPHTSQPAPGAFLELFQALASEKKPILVITLSAGLSGTFQSAVAAAKLCRGVPIQVIDSGTTAVGMIRLAERALALSAQGVGFLDIVAQITAMRDKTFTMFVPKTLEYLHKGGRIGGAAALLGTILQIKPILYLVGGAVSILDKVRTSRKALERMMAELEHHNQLAYIAIVHIEAPETAQAIQKELESRFPLAPISVSTGGAVLGSHLGPGLVGIIYQEKIP